MKRFWMGALVLTLGAGAWALDANKLATLEREEGGLMQTTGVPALQALEATLTPQASASDPRSQFRWAVVAHNLSRALPGKGWANKAVQRFEALVKTADPELAVVVRAYLGSSQALAANDDLNPAMKIVLVNQGWDSLTEAVNRGGDATFLPRFLRASVGQALPEFFGKAPSVVADTRALVAWSAAHPGRMDGDFEAQIALMEGNALKKTKDLDGALAAWRRAVVLDPTKKGAGKTAAAALALYED